jgi:hypothetical protein
MSYIIMNKHLTHKVSTYNKTMNSNYFPSTVGEKSDSISSDSKDSEDYRKLKKYIGIDSDENKNIKSKDKDKEVCTIITLKKYNKIIKLFQDNGIEIKKSNKKKTLLQFLELCHKQKKTIIKNHVIDIAKYATLVGYKQLAGTYIIESKNDQMIHKMRAIDKIIEYINKENYVDQNNNIISLLNIKQPSDKKKKSKLSADIVLEEFSDMS